MARLPRAGDALCSFVSSRGRQSRALQTGVGAQWAFSPRCLPWAGSVLVGVGDRSSVTDGTQYLDLEDQRSKCSFFQMALGESFGLSEPSLDHL